MDDEENVSLCERILLDLDNIFKRDTNILEFDIIDVVDSLCNKSPVVYVNHNIGLEKWCIPHLYDYAYKKILNYKRNNQRTDLYLLHQWTRIILLINPDFTTAWNLRRYLINNSVQSHLEDLKFTELVLIRKPKCASVYSYREWLLNQHLKSSHELSEELISNELNVTLDAASRYSRNYYAWSHRTWVITVFISQSNLHYRINKLLDDLVVTEKWLEAHISDYSCFQHRQCIFSYFSKLHSKFCQDSNNIADQNCIDTCDLFNTCKMKFFKEFELLDSLQNIYPEQESLFLHRRSLLHATLTWYPSEIDRLKAKENEYFQSYLFKLLSNKSCSVWQRELIKRYLSYLERNLRWTFES